ncbi:hypothetical protein D8B26_006781 [Coccidioides posadasii str. Silveira]|uniref:Predicted protein n=1 Tax=Coccidioides posadasii (strain RMSCC 757 / Silveira) TaxID=443226 RepID=E9CRK6_COCPS|nr:predicted protein [Coccidioides posadasii str. Silveira]QVM12146.1 hypothetical protein D8B26_006781 [Coccidioides posadasii str. Silveira]
MDPPDDLLPVPPLGDFKPMWYYQQLVLQSRLSTEDIEDRYVDSHIQFYPLAEGTRFKTMDQIPQSEPSQPESPSPSNSTKAEVACCLLRSGTRYLLSWRIMTPSMLSTLQALSALLTITHS